MIVKIFSMADCPKCGTAKKIKKEIDDEGIKTEYHDIKTVDGLAEAMMFGVMDTPSVVVVDSNNKELKIWKGSVPTIKEIKFLAEGNV
ncbi:MAG TPA: thioredoxin family protein [archaeon]|nr:thioredoxin family protein [archaeon]